MREVVKESPEADMIMALTWLSGESKFRASSSWVSYASCIAKSAVARLDQSCDSRKSLVAII